MCPFFTRSRPRSQSASLFQLGKKLKKNNVALDIVSFGTPDVDLTIPSASSSSSTSTSAPAAPETNDTKLSALVEATSSSDNSHFLSVEPGPYLLSEKIAQSAILRPEGADDEMGGAGGGGGGAADEFGVDPNLDPELAMVSPGRFLRFPRCARPCVANKPWCRAGPVLTDMLSCSQALRMSLEEERARQAAATAATSTSAAAALEPVPEGVSTQITDPTPATEPTGARLTSAAETTDADVMRQGGPFRGGDGDEAMVQVGGEGEHAADDDDADLRRALELSRAAGDEGAESDDVEMGGLPGVDDTVDGDEEDDIARASASLSLSLSLCICACSPWADSLCVGAVALSMQDAEGEDKETK